MTTLITAEEARKLSSEVYVESWMVKISYRIKYVATTVKTSIIFPIELTEILDERSVSPKQGAGTIVAQRLVEAGFTLKDHSECLYLTVEW